MKIIKFFILFSIIGYTEDAKISGKVYQIFQNKEPKIIQEFTFTINSTTKLLSNTTIAYNNGFFQNKKLKNFQVGEKVKIIPSHKNWKIVEPMNGELFLPNSEETNALIIKVVKLTPTYTVQFFVSDSKSKADKALDKLKKKGYTSSFIKEDNRGHNIIFYHVYTGRYPTENGAEKIKKSISDSKYFKSYGKPFIKTIN